MTTPHPPNHQSWKPISESEFRKLFDLQYSEFSETERLRFERFRVPFWKATIRRSDTAGDELVFVVSQNADGVLYFDDVEYGFNIGVVDTNGRIVEPGGSQATLKEAVEMWFPEL